jgi:tight adherence protein B
MAEFESQFPDALELLTRAMRAGHSLGIGFQLVGEELADPVGSEFAQVAEEIKFGLDVRQALANLAHRMDIPDLPYFVAAILIQRETGGNLAELLERLGTLVRDRAKFHGKLRALTSQGRMSATVLALWPAVTVALLIVVHPTYIQPMLETTSGHIAMLASAVLVTAGYLLARKLATVEV